MTITIHKLDHIKDNIQFDYNLLFEMILLLTLISTPDDYSHRDWAKGKRNEIPEDMLSIIDFWGSFERWTFLLDLLTKKNFFPIKSSINFLNHFQDLPCSDFLSSLWDKPYAWKEKDEEKYRRFESAHYKDVLANPEQEIDNLKRFFRWFYKEHYEGIMEKVELALVQTINEKLMEFNRLPPEKFYQRLGKKMTYNDGALTLHAWYNKNLEGGKDVTKIIWMPSVFSSPHSLYDDTCLPGVIFIAIPVKNSPFLNSHIPGDEFEYLAGTFRALGDPQRLKILARLAEKPSCNQDLARELGLNKSTISKHISRLRHYYLVEGEEIGNNRIRYRLGSNFMLKNLSQFNFTGAD